VNERESLDAMVLDAARGLSFALGALAGAVGDERSPKVLREFAALVLCKMTEQSVIARQLLESAGRYTPSTGAM
jgi:hypothetical protein